MASTTAFGTAAVAVACAVAASVTPVLPRSYAAFTAVGVAARMLLVVLVESLSCTTPADEVDAALTLMAGVVPPLETIGAVPVTLVTVPVAGVVHCVL